jgi:cystathionine beta-lyase/cystathionine gamma-synthase
VSVGEEGDGAAPAPLHADLVRALALATGRERIAPPLEVVAIGVGAEAATHARSHERRRRERRRGPQPRRGAHAVHQVSERIRTALAGGVPARARSTVRHAAPSDATSAAWAGLRSVDGPVDDLEEAVRAWERGDACAAFVTGEAAVRAALHATHGTAPRVVAVLDPHSVALRTLVAHGPAPHRGARRRRGARGRHRRRCRPAVDHQPGRPGPAGLRRRAVGARASGEGAVVVFDATGATAVPTHPLRFGADLVVHADVAALAGSGAVGHPTAADQELRGGLVVAGDAELVARTVEERSRTDTRMRPATAERLLAGFRSHPLRAERRAANALALARFLKRHPRVRDVVYPGLPGHPDAGRVPECGPARWGPT